MTERQAHGSAQPLSLARPPRLARKPRPARQPCSLTQGDVENHHDKEAANESEGGGVGVFVPLGFRDDFLNDHINHGAGGEGRAKKKSAKTQ